MWRFFSKKEKKITRKKSLNWCLFIRKDNSSGVFFTNMGPGIKDCKNGVLYIACGDNMPKINLNRLTANAARRAILQEYGIVEGREIKHPKDYY